MCDVERENELPVLEYNTGRRGVITVIIGIGRWEKER